MFVDHVFLASIVQISNISKIFQKLLFKMYNVYYLLFKNNWAIKGIVPTFIDSCFYHIYCNEENQF